MNEKAVYGLLIVIVALASVAAGYYLIPQPETPVETETITWVMGHGYHYGVAVVMNHLNLMEKYSDGKLTLELVILKGPAVSEALISGAGHFGQRSAPAILKDIDNEAPFKMLLSVGKKDHELWTNNPDIKSLEDITKDHIISLVNPNSIGEMGFKMAFAKLGRTLDDVQVAHLKHTDAYQAMITGQIDLDYSAAPFQARYAQEPDKYTCLGTDTDFYGMALPASMIYLNENYADENPEVVAIVISAWLEAITWINEHEEEAATVIAEFYGDPLDEAYQDFKESNIVFNPYLGLSALKPLSEKLYEAGLLTKAYEMDEVLLTIARSMGG